MTRRILIHQGYAKEDYIPYQIRKSTDIFKLVQFVYEFRRMSA